MWICKYFVYFIIFSFFGWIWETIYCTVKNREWANRGFLFAPLCPIYGVGAVAIILVANNIGVSNYQWWHIFIIAVLGSMVLEYVTSWLLEKLFHAYWWDYSDMPLNINGRICLPCSLGFGVAGLIVIYVLYPFVLNITSWITPIAYEAISLVFMAAIAFDTATTVCVLTDFENSVAQWSENVNIHMEQWVEEVSTKVKTPKEILAVASNELSAISNRNSSVDVEAERERYYVEHFKRNVANMGGISKSVLKRVKGFRQTKKVERTRMNDALTQLREHMKKIPKRK